MTIALTVYFDLSGLPALPAIALGFLAAERRLALADAVRKGSDPPGRPSSAAHSTCGVCGNMSTGCAPHEPVAVVVDKPLEVAGERGRVARDVDDARRGDLAEPLERLAGETCARRVDDDHVRVAGAVAQVAQAPPRRSRRRTRRCRSPFSSWFSIAHATDSSEISIPQTVSADAAIDSPIVPIPQ